MKTAAYRHRMLSVLSLMLFLTAAGGVGSLTGQPLEIGGIEIGADGSVTIGHPSDSAAYYILYRGLAVGEIRTPVDLRLGFDGVGVLTDDSLPAGAESAFYRIRQVPLDQPLDLDGDGMDDVYELTRTRFLDPFDPADAGLDFDRDGATNREEYDAGTDPETGIAVTSVSASPFNGERGVAVTRETIIRFSDPLADGQTVGPDQLFASFGGNRLPARIALSSDRRKATLFYLDRLPPSARIRVHVDGNTLSDQTGVAVDADGDGLPGGVGVIDFDTLSVTPVANTGVVGRVFASELVPGENGMSINRPLEGVVITVDGMEETMRAVTDEMGNFSLAPVPAGTFFVHIDGRTATDSDPENGDYYPTVGKSWKSVAGRADTPAGGTGEVYLPLIKQGTLRDVSDTEDTEITLPDSVLEANPQLAGVSITVPADSLFKDNGERGGRVGIAPVPSDRLPGKLPEGLNFPMVMTVQTDGATNFDRPVPVRFKNMPDPETGERLEPGAKSALWSFDHDTGEWGVVGPMTVTDDGEWIVTDPGVGILAPGWHCDATGTPCEGPRFPPRNPCRRGATTGEIVDTIVDAGVGVGKCAAEFFAIRDALKTALTLFSEVRGIIDNARQLKKDIDEGKGKGVAANTLKILLNSKNITVAAIEALKKQSLFGKLSAIASCAETILGTLESICGRFGNFEKGPCQSSIWVRGACLVIKGAKATIVVVNRFVESAEQSFNKTAIKGACALVENIASNLDSNPAGSSVNPGGAGPGTGARAGARIQVQVQDDGGDPVSDEVAALATELAALTDELEADFAPLGLVTEAAISLDEQLNELTTAFANFYAENFGLPSEAYYLIEIGGLEIRGRTDDNGQVREILAPNQPYSLAILDPATGRIGTVRDVTAESGFSTVLPLPLFAAVEDPADADNDTLSDAAERIIGTFPTDPDSDDDGVLDGIEVAQGSDPLDGIPVATGVVASVDTPGTAVDVCVVNDLAIVADSEAGVEVFNVFGGLNPTIVAQIVTPGRAERVACSGTLVAVADSLAGVVIVDISDPPAAIIRHTVNLGNSVRALVADAGIVYAGLDNGRIVAIDLMTGEVLHEGRLGTGRVRDLAFGGETLFALSEDFLFSFEYLRGALTQLARAGSPTVSTRNQRLFVGGDIAYAVHGKGYNTIDVSNPADMTLISAANTDQFGWKQIVLNGSGLGLAAVGANASFDGVHDVTVYNTGDPVQTDQPIVTFPTPGIARAVSIFNGLGYVADHAHGLQVINYLPFDSLGVPPTVAISAPSGEDATVEEGSSFLIAVDVADDVQVRSVSFLVDGTVVAVDGNFPFEARAIAPAIAEGKTAIRVEAQATDTGGNRTLADPVEVALVPDATPPRIGEIIPGDGAGSDALRSLAIFFNESIDPATLSDETVQLVALGSDGIPGTEDDTVVAGGDFDYQPEARALYLTFAESLPTGSYQLTVTTGIADSAGNPIETAVVSRFSVGFGLTGEYYNGPNFDQLMLTRVDPTINFDWGAGEFGTPAPEISPDRFSVRWRGRIVPEFSETYTLSIVSDDGIRLWIDGELILANWTVHARTENRGTVELIAGEEHDIRIEFFEAAGFAVAQMMWSSESQEREVVPSVRLLPYRDVVAPALIQVLPDPSFRRARLIFDDVLEEGSALDPANYQFSDGVTVLGAALASNGSEVVLSTTEQAPNTLYTVAVSDVTDASDQRNPVAPGSVRTFHSFQIGPGFVRQEFFDDIAGDSIDELTLDPDFPDRPDAIEFLTAFDAPRRGLNAFGRKLSGWIAPPRTGNYVFYVSSDDAARLLLSSDSDPANRQTIAAFTGATAALQWDGFAGQKSDPIRLTGGDRYFFEALSKQGFGNDHVSVAWQFVPDPANLFYIEAEDFDYDGGMHRGEADIMPYADLAYDGLSAVAEIDYNDPGPPESSTYRTADQGVGNLVSFDTERMGYTLEQDFKIGFNVAGDWYNYTRVFPEGAYNVYARVSSGGQAINARLDEVTAGAGTASQELRAIGTFSSPRTASYTVFKFVPLLDDAGHLAELNLDGEHTLRFTVLPGNLDLNYLMLVPSIGTGPAIPIETPRNGADAIPGDYLYTYASAIGTGQLLREVYLNVEGSELTALTNHPRFPDAPDRVDGIGRFEAPINFADQYGQRLSGYLSPPRDGVYRFFLASDDQSRLYLAPGDDPSGKEEIAFEPLGANSRAWQSLRNRNPDQPENRSAAVTLAAGQQYYVEAVMKENDRSDSLAVAWNPPTGFEPDDGMDPISGSFLSMFRSPEPVRIAAHPIDQTVVLGQKATFSVSIRSALPRGFQWFRDGTPIPGATGNIYTTDWLNAEDNGAVFHVEVRHFEGTLTSNQAVLTVDGN